MSDELRQIGVEEELFLVDAVTGRGKPVSQRALRADEASDAEDEEVEQELFLEQIETATEPCRTLDELAEHVVAARRRAAEAAARADASLMASGTLVVGQDEHVPTPDERYGRIIDTFGALGRQATVCGMHVHVDVDGDDPRVRVVDALRPWLPLLIALSANSPFDNGEDTGHASWRGVAWDRWPAAGPGETFGSAAGYRAAIDGLVSSGAVLDEGMVYLDARPAASFPTVEVRVADVCADVDDVVLIAALTRALVDTVAEEDPAAPWRVEMLRAARWLARKDGPAGRLLHPVTAEPVAAEDAFAVLVDHVSPALQRAGDADLVRTGIDRVLRTGGGAARQREAARTDGLVGVVRDLVARTTPDAD